VRAIFFHNTFRQNSLIGKFFRKPLIMAFVTSQNCFLAPAPARMLRYLKRPAESNQAVGF
jgi:hypothetical protein